MKNKIWSALLSVLIAFSLWLYVVTTVSTEHEEVYYGIPVVFDGESVLAERGLMITSDLERITVNLTINGPRSELQKINKSNITLKANLANVYDAGENRNLNYTISFPGDVNSNSLNVVNREPGHVVLDVARKLTKEVPVNVVYTGSAPEGFMTDTENGVLDYQTVTVSGPSEVVDLIAQARIDVDLKDRRESISENFRYTLCDENGEPVDVELVTTNVGEVHLDLKIQSFKEIPLVYTVVYGGGATEQTAKISLQPEKIQVSGSETLLEEMTELNLGTIDLSAIESNTSMTFPIVLPEGVNNLSGITEATMDISFMGLTTKTFAVEQIQVVNVPEGMEYTLLNDVIQVKLRGLSALISAIEADDIIVTLDFTGKEVGTSTVKATVTVKGDAYTSVGAVGTHTVAATLRMEDEN